MNSLFETLNLWGGRIPNFAWPMLWQSSVLIAVLVVFDLAARRKVRASVRYALWLVVLVKLLLPPTLALPTSLAWWVRPPAPPPKAQAQTTTFVVTYGDFVPANFQTPAPPVFAPPPKPSLSGAGRAAATWALVGAGLLAWLVAHWRKVAGDVRQATVAPESLCWTRRNTASSYLDAFECWLQSVQCRQPFAACSARSSCYRRRWWNDSHLHNCVPCCSTNWFICGAVMCG